VSALLAVAVVAIALLQGCRGDCSRIEESHCEGNRRFVCSPPGVDQLVGGGEWIESDCATGTTCLNPTPGKLVCSLSSEPSPACAPASTTAGCEDERTHVACDGGYATARASCVKCVPATSERGATCEGAATASCTSDPDCVAGLRCNGSGFCAP
jgi:hypothetical protein